MDALFAFAKRRRIALSAIALTIVVYAAIGFFLVPRLAKNAIETYVRDTMHRQVDIGDLTFNPFTLTVQVRNFAMREADGVPIASFSLLRVNAELKSLIFFAPSFKEITLVEPRVAVVILEDGALNLAKLAPPPGPESAESTGEQEPPPALRIDEFALRAGRIDLEDRTRAQPFTATLQPITFELHDFRTTRDYNNEYSFNARSDHDETFAWSGTFSVLPLRSSGKFSVGKLTAGTIADYLQEQLPVQLTNGIVDLDGAYQVVVTDSVDVRVQLPSVRLEQLAIAAKGEATPWITAPSIAISNSEFSLAERSVHVGGVQVKDVAIDVWREPNGQINLQRMLPASEPQAANAAPAVAAPAPVPAPAASSPWKFKLDTLQLNNATVRAEDRAVSPTAAVALGAVELKVDNIASTPGNISALQTGFTVNETGHLEIIGSVQLTPLVALLDVGAQSIDLRAAQPYLNESTDIALRQGRFGTKARIEYREQPAKKESRLLISGDADILDFGAQDTHSKEELLSWRSLRMAGLRYTQGPDQLDIARIALAKPYARIVIDQGGQLNLGSALKPKTAKSQPSEQPATTAAAAEAKSAPPMPMRIRRIQVDNGDMYFADFSVNPSFATGVNSLNGQVVGLSSDPKSRADLQISGSVDRYAPVQIGGTVNLLSADSFSDVSLKFSNMELTTFNPYSGKFAGYNIVKGKLSTELHYLVQQRKLDAKHHIVLDQLEFGDATESKDAVPMPIKFAVALLKDSNGVITLDLPVAGTLDDPTFRVGPIVWQVLKNILTKITTAPFAAIGALFGGGDDLQFIEFAPGSTKLDEAQLAKIKTIQQALVSRPQLQLDVPLTTNGDADREALARAAFDQALAANPPKYTGDDLKRADDARLKSLTDIYVKQLKVQPTFPADAPVEVPQERIAFLERELRAAFMPSADAVSALARERGAAVQTAVLADTAVGADRVFLTARANEAESNNLVVRMELKLDSR